MAVSAPAAPQLSVKFRPATLVVRPGDGEAARLPAGLEAASAQFLRQGGDLELVLPDGRHVLIPGYFTVEGRSLVTADGQMLPADLVARLAGPLAPGQYAQAGGGEAGLVPIGVVDRLTGTVTVRHADGTSTTLNKGETVFQGDVVETGGQGAVGVIFADRSTFSLGGGARMVLDELVYDPGTKAGHAQISVTNGSFSFISGQLAKAAPDAMVVRTPVMTIGVRGTTVAGQVGGGGQSEVVLLADPGGQIGEVVLSNAGGGFQIINQPNTLVGVSSATAAFSPPVVVSAADINQRYGQAVTSLPPPPTQSRMEWNTTPGQAEKPPVEQIQQREGADQVIQVTPGGTTTAPQPDPATVEPNVSEPIPDPRPPPPVTEPGPVPPQPISLPVPPVPDPPPQPLPVPVDPQPNPDPPKPVDPQPDPKVIIMTTPVYDGSGRSDNLTVTGTAGNDTITTGSGNDTIAGGLGNDTIAGGAGSDFVSYASAVLVALASGTAIGGAGNDALSGIEGVIGSAFADTLIGSTGADTLTGGGGDDVISGGVGDDVLSGEAGTDTLDYGSAASAVTVNLTTGTATGGEGNDTISGFELVFGSAYADSLSGSAGNDSFMGGLGNDVIDGAGGIDAVSYLDAAAAVVVDLSLGTATGGAGNDTLSGIEVAEGSAYADTLTGSAGDDSLRGGMGDDILDGGLGNDALNGETGTDTLTYAAAASAVVVDLSLGTATGGAGNDTLTGIEAVVGTAYGDTLTGTTAAEALLGGDGNDVIAGGSGADVLQGGLGDDTLTHDSGATSIDGGGGTDTLSLSSSLNLASTSVALAGIEAIDLGGTGSVTVSAATVTALSSTSDILFVKGTAGASLSLYGTWAQGGDEVVGATTYHVLTSGGATVKVQAGVSYTLPVAPTIAMNQGLSFSTLQTDPATYRSLGWDTIVADIDGDGDKDLLAQEGVTGNLYYGANNGSGTFTFGYVTSSNVYNGSSIAAGDFNNDGKLDVVAVGTTVTNANTILVGDGAGNFTPLSQTDAGVTTASSTAVTTGDVDGDGDTDIIAVGASSKVFLNNAGQFTVASTLTTTTANDAVLLDIDRDGDLDLVASNWGANYEVFRNDGSGAFTEIAGWTNTAAQRQFDAFDLNGDGLLDILASNRGEQGAIYLNNGDGTATLATNRFGGTGITYGGGAGDLDGDGDLDVVNGMEGQTERIYRNDGTGNVTQVATITLDGNASATGFGANYWSSNIEITDLTGDGRNDVLVTHYGSTGGGPGYVIYKNTTATTACAVTGAAVSPLAGLTLADSDSSQLSGATVGISSGFIAGDALAFTAVGAITGSYDSASHILTLTGTDTVANYQAALQSVTFATAANSTTGLRGLSMTVTDASGLTDSAGTWVDAVNTDPLVLDLDLDGLDLMAATDAAFDIDADGDADRTGWVGGGDGLLAVDFDHSGTIDDGSELVSPFMDLGGNADGPVSRSVDALATWDDNHDFRIDAADAIFQDLKVWVDADADKTSQGGELLTMDMLGIKAFLIDAFGAGGEVAGNTVLRTLGVEMTDGSIMQAGEVVFGTTPATPAEEDAASYTVLPADAAPTVEPVMAG